ncbi:TIR domain-containing protein [Bifidobacterium amazonense]|uniref:TIR domain-containing protein n=1 Tax=Bifidobacterium amazonense TaxID=2809027 RepID=A0ABS9VY17_9BIFI|nr:TIR domain-containing protein [Bifidobacterium amazonense]MCH9277007.1 TIR domain-containing protein [Bifidobacterium amazonense]
MAYRNKTYVAFDGDEDMRYYQLLKAWNENDNIDFDFYDAHDLNYAYDTNQEESIKNQLRKRFDNSKLFILLVGEKTKRLRKFIPWKIDQALNRELPVVVVNLNGEEHLDADRCPTKLQEELAVHIPFKAAILNYAVKNWPDADAKYRKEGETGAYIYNDSVYSALGT